MSQQKDQNKKLAEDRHINMAEAFEIFAKGMSESISQRMQAYLGEESWTQAASAKLGRPDEHGNSDPYFQLLVIRRFWGPVFSDLYKEDLRPIIGELIEFRNKWAHFALPEDISLLVRAVVIMERLLAPADPDASIEMRKIKFQLNNPTERAENSNVDIDLELLLTELDEATEIFEDLKEKNEILNEELDTSRKISATKQLELSAMETQLSIIQGKSLAFEHYLSEQRAERDRIEWLFVGLLAAILLIMIFSLR